MTVRLKDDDLARLEAAAKAKRVSVADFVRVAALAAALAIGCADSGGFRQLAAPERELFHRCWSSMERPICGEPSSGVYMEICSSDARKKYAAKPTAEKRAKWLVAHGCPKDMVVASQEDDEDEEESR